METKRVDGEATTASLRKRAGEGQTTKSIMNKEGNSGAVISNTPEPALTRAPQVVFQKLSQGEQEVALQAKENKKGTQPVIGGLTESLRSIIGSESVHRTSIQEETGREHPHFIVEDELHTPTRQLSPETQPTDGVVVEGNGERKISKEKSPVQIVVPTPSLIPSTGETVLKDILVPKRENSKNIDVRLPTDDGKLHILIGCCGTPAVFKLKSIIKKIEDIYGRDKVSIQVILTFSARRFFAKKLEQQAFMGGKKLPPSCEIPAHIRIWNDIDEWDTWKQRSDPVLHIELRRWADILLIAPLTANTLSKISLGLCDNLLTCVVRAWNPNYPILLAPSMISSVYNSVMTKKQVGIVRDEMPWITILKPSEKIVGVLGDIGLGGMMDINEIVDKVVGELGGYPNESTSEDKNDDDEDEDDEEEDQDDEDAGGDEDRNTTQEEADDDDDDDDEDDDDDDTEEEGEEEKVIVAL